MLKAIATMLLIALATVTLVACGDDDEGAATVPPSPATSSETAVATVITSRPATGTGVAIVDQVIAAVAAKDAAKLVSLLHFWPTPCTGPPENGTIACPTGAPVGTIVLVIGVSGGQGVYMKPGDLAITTAAQSFLAQAGKVYAVIRGPTFSAGGDSAVPGKYQIVFEQGPVASVDDQGITYLTFNAQSRGAGGVIAGRFGLNPDYLVRP